MADLTMTVNLDKTASLNKSYLALQGEQVTIDAVLASGLESLGYDGYIDFLQPDGLSYFKGPYDCSSGTVSFTLGALDSVLDRDGIVYCQFVLAETVGSVRTIKWLSKQIKTIVLPSVLAASSAILPYVPQMVFPVQYPAANISVADVAGRFVGNTDEDVLAEIGSQLADSAIDITEIGSQLADSAIDVKNPPTGLTACAVDGVTDDSTAFNAIYQYAFENGKDVYIPGIMMIKSTIGLDLALTGVSTFPSIFGNQAMAIPNVIGGSNQTGSIIKYEGTGAAVRIRSSSIDNAFQGGLIRNIAILKKDGDRDTDGSIGLSLKECVDYRLFNVSIIGFDIGFKNDYGWSFDTFGLICVRNNIGVLLEDNSNAAGLHGSQLHQNNINIKIVSGTNIIIDKATLEGANSIGVVITKGASALLPSNIKMSNLYFEANSACFKLGKDEDDVQSASTISGISIDNVNLETPGIVPFELDNVTDIDIKNISWGQLTPLFSSTPSTGRISFTGFKAQYESDIGDRYTASRRIGVHNRTNLLPGGFLNFPSLKDFTRGGFVAVYDITTFVGEKVVKIIVPDASALNPDTRIMVKIDSKMVGKRLIFSGTAQADANLTAAFAAYTPAGSGIAGASVTIPEAMEKVGFYFACPDEEYVSISIRLTNASGATKYCYIKAMCLVESGVGEVQPNTLDYLSGLSGSVAGLTTGTVVPLVGWKSDMYEVIVTPKSAITAYVTLANDQFTITTVGGNGAVSYLIIPKVGMFI